MIIAVIVLGLIVLVLIALVLKGQKPVPVKDDSSALLLKADMTELNKSVMELKDGLQKQLSDQMGNSAKSMQAQWASSNKILTEVTQRLTELDKTNKNVGDIASELKTLQNVLQNPKQRGVLGEYYLEQILKNILPPGAFELQFKIGEGLIVDAVIKLDDKVLPIDSKFSLENYNRLIDAKESDREALEKTFKSDIKNRIDETSKYVLPSKGTLDQAFMFIPSEAIYYDLLSNKVGLGAVSGRNLMQYASEKKVSIVGPTTLSAMLQTVMQGLRSMEIHKDTEKIQKNIEQLQKHLMAHNTYMSKLGVSLGTTVGHFNMTYKELGKIDRDIVKIAHTEATVEPALLERPSLLDD
jgi:DNA recombination protein RmuC